MFIQICHHHRADNVHFDVIFAGPVQRRLSQFSRQAKAA